MGSPKVSLPTLMTLIGVPSTLSAVLFLSSSSPASELVITSNMKKVVKDTNVKDFIVCFWNDKKKQQLLNCENVPIIQFFYMIHFLVWIWEGHIEYILLQLRFTFLKFNVFEKATKIWNNLPFFWRYLHTVVCAKKFGQLLFQDSGKTIHSAEKKNTSYKRAGFFTEMKQKKKFKMADLENSQLPPHTNLFC